MKKLKVRLASRSWKPPPFVEDGVIYSMDVSFEEADGLIALYDPNEELLRFKGPKLWYTIEPMWHSHFRRDPIGRQLVKRLHASEWVYYANPDPRYRVPHITLPDGPTRARADAVYPRAVAVVSNFGGRFWFLKRHIHLRNRMIQCPLVDLYGREAAWRQFHRFPASWRKGPPANYRGEAPADHVQEEFIAFLSAFKVCVCLENSCEPYYFTEKFVNAVRAGCIPVYHAHATVRERFLKDARWVDPAEFGFSPMRTIQHALAQDRASFQEVNDAWLDSGILDDTTTRGFWKTMCRLMGDKLQEVYGRAGGSRAANGCGAA